MKTLECIMLVDDDADTNFYNKIVLEQTDATNEIVVFENGKDALMYLEKGNNKVDLILLDINMPIMNGWQFLEHYEKLDENKKKEADNRKLGIEKEIPRDNELKLLRVVGK